MKKGIKIAIKIGRILSTLIIVFIAFLVVATTVSEFKGYRVLVVVSSSMSPAIKQGSMVLVKNATEAKKGDIITYRLRIDPRSLVTHRVVEVVKINNEDQYRVKGDAVPQPDLELINKSQLIGKIVFSIPYLGFPVSFAKTQLGVVVLIIIPASIIVYEEIRTILNEIKQLRLKVKKLDNEEKEFEEEMKEKLKHGKKK